MDVDAWLRGLGCEQYQRVFRDQDIDGEVLPHLGEEDLQKLGVSLGHRKRMLRAIRQLPADATSPDGAAAPTVPVGASGQSEHLSISARAPAEDHHALEDVAGYYDFAVITAAILRHPLAFDRFRDPRRLGEANAYAIKGLFFILIAEAFRRWIFKQNLDSLAIEHIFMGVGIVVAAAIISHVLHIPFQRASPSRVDRRSLLALLLYWVGFSSFLLGTSLLIACAIAGWAGVAIADGFRFETDSPLLTGIIGTWVWLAPFYIIVPLMEWPRRLYAVTKRTYYSMLAVGLVGVSAVAQIALRVPITFHSSGSLEVQGPSQPGENSLSRHGPVANQAGLAPSAEASPESGGAASPSSIGKMPIGAQLAIQVGDRIYFAAGKATIDNQANGLLQRQADWLKANPDVALTIEGHTDDAEAKATGPSWALAGDRATNTKKALVALGVAADRIAIVSRGSMQPAVTGDNEAARAQNRRAVLVVTGSAAR